MAGVPCGNSTVCKAGTYGETLRDKMSGPPIQPPAMARRQELLVVPLLLSQPPVGTVTTTSKLEGQSKASETSKDIVEVLYLDICMGVFVWRFLLAGGLSGNLSLLENFEEERRKVTLDLVSFDSRFNSNEGFVLVEFPTSRSPRGPSSSRTSIRLSSTSDDVLSADLDSQSRQIVSAGTLFISSPSTLAKQRMIAVVGSHSVGKSSLAVRYVDGHFVESYYPSIGSTISKEFHGYIRHSMRMLLLRPQLQPSIKTLLDDVVVKFGSRFIRSLVSGQHTQPSIGAEIRGRDHRLGRYCR
ncbi:uncharacterized protein B0T15DRAFT_570468 [Chaetomium strumarium]|uniref:Uncharacterized protein n=1 Tax=Chaetomium strumarium TaxID=1170767 RepID=A0AAJ0H0W1_9PEZI|nr:hypothetical protein B0T15DRAFT_570468 [Chaetomium strumarium]